MAITTIPKILNYTDGYNQYPGSSGGTTQAQTMEYTENQNQILRAIVAQGLWQPSMDVAVGDVVRTPLLASNLFLVCVKAGKTGTVSPDYTKIGGY